MAPGIIGPGTTAYIAAHNQIRAHARAYRAYEAEFSAVQGGKVGITLNVNWCEPRDPSDQADITASDTCMNFNLGWYAHAIFVDGKYPEVRSDRGSVIQSCVTNGFKTTFRCYANK